MIIDSIVIIIAQRKKLKFIYVLANSLFSAGLCLIVMSIIVKVIVLKMTKLPLLKLSILLKHGLIELIIGLVVMIVYKMIVKRVNKKGGPHDEISQTEF